MTQNRKKSPTEGDAEPGADRFWDGFASAGSRRSGAGREPDPEEPAGSGAQAGPGPSPDGGHSHVRAGECLEWCPVCRSAELFRSAVTPELREQAEALQQEALNIFHAFLTAYSERTGGSGPAPADRDRPAKKRTGQNEPAPGPDVTDIPLD